MKRCKPHLVRIDGTWYCISRRAKTRRQLLDTAGVGDTPREAWRSYLRKPCRV